MESWKIVEDVLKLLASETKPGVTTNYLDCVAEKRISELGGLPYNKGYLPKWATTAYPASICASVNDSIVHGIPNDIPLKEGDIVTLDVGVKKDDLCGDAAITVGVGKISNRDDRLIRYAKRTLEVGMEQVKAGVMVSKISEAMDIYAKRMGFLTNIPFCGHGIGVEMHEKPYIPNLVNELTQQIPDEALKEGQMLCIEPTISYKDRVGVLQFDGWTWKTRDGRNAAMFESQIRVTQEGYDLLIDL